MTRVRFYHNAADPLALACELAARAAADGRKVAVRTTDARAAQRFDAMLWSFDQLAFVPHVRSDSPLAARTPVVIGSADHPAPWPHADLLFNLAQDVPGEFDQFRMLVEIVGDDETEKAPARARWMHYKSRSLPLQAFDALRREAM